MIKGARLSLRHVIETDLPLLIEAASDPVMRGEFGTTQMTSPHEIRKRYLENGFSSPDNERLMICDEAGRVIGNIGHFVERRYATAREMGWFIFDPANRGKGYASEATQLAIDYLFQSFPIHRVSCSLVPENTASRRVAEKCGFRYEGRARGVLFVRGQYLDADQFGLLRPEWEQSRRG